MTGVAEEPRKPFDLRKFAPPPVQFTWRDDVTYNLPGDPPVEAVLRMLRLEEALKAADTSAVAEPLGEARDLILDMLEGERQDPNADIDDIHSRLSSIEVLTLFALITGGESAADAVVDGITSAMAVGSGGGAEEDADPLPSVKRSSARSSRRAPTSKRSRTTTRG